MSETQKAPPKRGGGPMGMGGPMGGMGPVEKAKDFKGAFAKLVNYMGKYTIAFVFVIIMATVSTVLAILGPKIMGNATDELFKGIMSKVANTGNIDFDKIAQIMLTLLMLYVISAVFLYVQGFIMSGITMKLTYRLRKNINDKIHTLPLGYFDKTTHGDVLSRITNDVDTISQTLSQNLTQIITSVTSVIGITVMMFTISWELTLAALCVLPLTAIFVLAIMKNSKKHFANQQKSLGEVNGHVEEMFGSHVIVKAFNGEEDSTEAFSKYNDSLYNAAWKANALSGLIMPITGFISNIGYVVICILGGSLAAAGSMTVGGIQSFIQYVRQFTQPLSQIANISNVLQQTAAASERVFEFLGETEEVAEPVDALKVDRCQPDLGAVEFDHVAFGYKPETTIIRDFSAKLKTGQKVAIVGPTGAGKTTMVKLLMRFYDVNSGAILVDGQDIRLYKRNDLRSMFGMVLQDTWLFNGTITENIRYGNLKASDEDVKKAAVAAQVDHFVRTLPEGYNMVLNEEANNISQGQKQLLTIARAILADPEILILDEATSSVDTRTEIHIQKAMDNLMKGRTSFVIAHRLSTIRNADLILVMRDGDIVEQGTHDELISQNGFYTALYQSQFDTAS